MAKCYVFGHDEIYTITYTISKWWCLIMLIIQ